MRLILGIVLFTLPLVVLVAATVAHLGWRAAAAVWGISITASAMLIGGAHLIGGST